MEHTTVLSGEHVTLRPLSLADAPALAGIVDEEGWRWMTRPRPGPDPARAEEFIATSLAEPGLLPFAVVVAGAMQGITSYHDHAPAHLATFVGWTFYAEALRGDGRTNPEAKLLLLGNAFDVWGFERVGLRTDLLNLHSLAAIAKLGAVREGTMRSHLVRVSGGRRDTALFSVLRAEWPALRARLESRLGR